MAMLGFMAGKAEEWRGGVASKLHGWTKGDLPIRKLAKRAVCGFPAAANLLAQQIDGMPRPPEGLLCSATEPHF